MSTFYSNLPNNAADLNEVEEILEAMAETGRIMATIVNGELIWFTAEKFPTWATAATQIEIAAIHQRNRTKRRAITN